MELTTSRFDVDRLRISYHAVERRLEAQGAQKEDLEFLRTTAPSAVHLHLRRAAAALVREEVCKSAILPVHGYRVFRPRGPIDSTYAVYGDEVRYVIYDSTVLTSVPIVEGQRQNLAMLGIHLPVVHRDPVFLEIMYDMIQGKTGLVAEEWIYTAAAQQHIEQPQIVQETKSESRIISAPMSQELAWLQAFGNAWSVVLFEPRRIPRRDEQECIVRLLKEAGISDAIEVVMLGAPYDHSGHFIDGVSSVRGHRRIKLSTLPKRLDTMWFDRVFQRIVDQERSLTVQSLISYRLLHHAMYGFGWLQEPPEYLRSGMLVQHRYNPASGKIDVQLYGQE